MTPPDAAVLVTGATGLVGSQLVEQLRADGADVAGTSRRGSPADPGIVAWDMSAEQPPAALRRHWDAIVNAAASTRWTMGEAEATAANVASVRALELLVGAGTRVVHVSTAYATGLRGSVESADPADYRNTYEWSKAHAERVARESFANVSVVRPPLIVGRRADGRAARFAGMYTLVRGLTIGTVPAVVADPEARLDAIPVDDLCRLLARLATAGPGPGEALLTIAAGKRAPRLEEAIAVVVGSLNEWRQARGHEPLECPPLIEPERWRRFHRPFAQRHLSPRQLLIMELLESFEPYLALAQPLRPDVEVRGVLSCLRTSTAYWAAANPRVAALEPRPWRSPEPSPVAEAS
ncbi:MAG TPA: SDR family oxidoreductase [Solirubrobacterales bacterium]|nr:SDR family oxidoreductase [Solirubrobacterales bacterium]